MDKYYCYIIKSLNNNCTYTGITNDLDKRLKQHNGILKGGAKSTRKYNDWTYYKILEFDDKKTACSFEWFMKHKKNNNKLIKITGIENKCKRIEELKKDYKFDELL